MTKLAMIRTGMTRRFVMVSLVFSLTVWGHQPVQAVEKNGLKVLVIGATTGTSEDFIPMALEAGHEVIGLARRPHAVKIAHENLTVVKGDVYDVESLKAVMTGEEIVVSVYGPRTTPEIEIPESDLMSKGTANIIEAMKAKGNTRLFATSSTSVQRKIPETEPVGVPLTQKWMWNMRGIYRDMRLMEDVAHASGLDVIVLRPCQLLQERRRYDTQVAVDVDTPSRRLISYTDFSAFILDQLESDQYLGSTVGVYGERTIDWGGNVDFQAEMEKMKRVREQVEADL